MNFCNQCKIVFDDALGCPLCRERNLRAQAERRVDKLLEFRKNTMEKTVFTLTDLSKILGKTVETLYTWNSTKKPYSDFPFEKRGREVIVKKSKLIDWATQHNYSLELMSIA